MFPRIEAKMKELNPNGDIEDDWIKIYDEAAAWFATEIMGQYNIYFTPTSKHMNKKDHGLSLIKDQMIHNFVTISDRCLKLKWEMQMYVKTDKGEVPKKNDHLIDTWRYLNAAAHYNMVEAIEIQKQKSEKRGYTPYQDLKELQKEADWTFNIFDWED
jgi:hypothetical protein